MKKQWCSLSLLFLLAFHCMAQKSGITIMHEGTPTSIRGISMPSDDVAWVSGNNGHIGRSVDGGKTWHFMNIPGYEKKDFRDIEAFDSLTAVVMAIENPALILKTKDGGKNWKVVYTKSLSGMFLDAMDFKGKEGICIGDPIAVGSDGRKFFWVIKTHDFGDTWVEEPLYKLPQAAPTGEGIFSASGSNIALLDHPEFEYAFVSGGSISNLYLMGREGKRSAAYNIPINQGIESTGAFSLATDKQKKFYCIGGDYTKPNVTYDHFYFTTNEGKKWGSPRVAPPYGYRSCIKMIDENVFVCCGSNGVDMCKDAGNNWKSISKEGFNTIAISPNKKNVLLAGEKGKIGVLTY